MVVTAFDPDWSTDDTIEVWDLATGAVRAVLTGRTSWVHAVACTTIDSRPAVITTGRDETARIWDLATETELACSTTPAAPSAWARTTRSSPPAGA